MSQFYPSYLNLLNEGKLHQRAENAKSHLSNCDCCAWNCGIDRIRGQFGQCHSGILPRVSSFGPHFGEEAALSGRYGSGTIFFARCSLHCEYCQNFDISQTDFGVEIEPANLAAIMLNLQNQGCHNINLVTPSHFVPQIIAAIEIGANRGLALPIVYNSGGYDSSAMLSLLDGIIDIYMPDMKYADEEIAQRYSGIPNYPAVNQAAIREMHRQTGDLLIGNDGIAKRGLLVRHLVLPNRLAGTRQIAQFLVSQISPDTYMNLMNQYRPAYHAHCHPQLNRLTTQQEFSLAMEEAIRAGIHRFD